MRRIPWSVEGSGVVVFQLHFPCGKSTERRWEGELQKHSGLLRCQDGCAGGHTAATFPRLSLHSGRCLYPNYINKQETKLQLSQLTHVSIFLQKKLNSTVI